MRITIIVFIINIGVVLESLLAILNMIRYYLNKILYAKLLLTLNILGYVLYLLSLA